MRIGSINGNMAVSAYGTSREESAIRKRILALKKELQQVSSSDDEEEQEAAIRQREIEQQIAQLEQKIQQLKREDNRQSTMETIELSVSQEDMVKEPGKGMYVDTYV